MIFFNFRAVTSAYYRDAVGALVVYDITKLPTFENVSKWLDEINLYTTGAGVSASSKVIDTRTKNESTSEKEMKETSPGITTMLVGNKLDIRNLRTVPTTDAQSLARKRKVFFTETSALDSTNVEKAFTSVIHEIYERLCKWCIVVGIFDD